MIDLKLYQHAKALMTCAPAWECPREEACFYVCKYIVDRYENQQRSAAIKRSEAAAETSGEVAHYAPHFPPAVAWEWARPDWDAA